MGSGVKILEITEQSDLKGDHHICNIRDIYFL